MLEKIRRQKLPAPDGNFVIVASRYRAGYVEVTLHAGREEFLRAGVRLRIVCVPGALEIPATLVSGINRSSISFAATSA